MSQKPTISDLLALRDGEPLPAAVRQALADDPRTAERLAELQQIKTDLAGLPDITPDESLWADIAARVAERAVPQPPLALAEQPRTAATSAAGGWQLRYPLATAAGVFLAAVLVSLLWLPQLRDNDPAAPAIELAGRSLPLNTQAPSAELLQPGIARAALPDPMSTLIDRSQRLEAVARLPVARAIDGQQSSRQALLYRIADLDAQLNSLIEEEPMDPALKEKLWRQRVALLETLVAVQQDQLANSPGLY